MLSACGLVVLLDADMAAKRHFFMKVLEMMWDEEPAFCLTPQVRFFHLCSCCGYLCIQALVCF
jgi:hypothetical protein